MREVEALTKQQVTKMELPTTSDIIKHRESQTVENLKIWLGRGRFKRELEMVQELIDGWPRCGEHCRGCDQDRPRR
jgi:hypothetical protein